jgi:hypothetical protein
MELSPLTVNLDFTGRVKIRRMQMHGGFFREPSFRMKIPIEMRVFTGE